VYYRKGLNEDGRFMTLNPWYEQQRQYHLSVVPQEVSKG
jgi:hypothetical protein